MASDCGHICCAERHDPFHDHFLRWEDCPVCRRLDEQALDEEYEPELNDGSGVTP